MRKTTNAVLAILVLLTASLAAQEPTAPVEEQVEETAAIELELFEGLLVEIDLDLKKFLVTNSDVEMEFKFSDATEVIGLDEGVAGLASATDAMVRVHFRAEPEGNTAVRIEILPPAI